MRYLTSSYEEKGKPSTHKKGQTGTGEGKKPLLTGGGLLGGGGGLGVCGGGGGGGGVWGGVGGVPFPREKGEEFRRPVEKRF